MVSLYRSPTQMSNEFEIFFANLEKLVFDFSGGHSDFVLLIDNFNVKSRNSLNQETTTAERAQLDSQLASFSMKKLITEPLKNMSNCIDLIFTNQPNIVLVSGVHSPLHPKCHHQKVHLKLNLNIEYLPPYTREIGNYDKGETNLIKRSIENFDLSDLFLGKNVHEQV